jgi:hypothetical protein
MEANLTSREEKESLGTTAPAWQRRFSQAGWITVIGCTILLLLLPLDNLGQGLPVEVWLLLVALLFLVIWITLFGGVLLLMAGYVATFKRVGGVLLFATLLALSFNTWSFLGSGLAGANWFVSQLFFLTVVWLLVLPFALGAALLLYLVYQDKAVQATAVTLMIFVWTILIYARYRGPEYLLHEVILGSNPGQYWWFQTVLCLTLWLLILAPLSFLGHTFRLIYQEFSAGDRNYPLESNRSDNSGPPPDQAGEWPGLETSPSQRE